MVDTEIRYLGDDMKFNKVLNVIKSLVGFSEERRAIARLELLPVLKRSLLFVLNVPSKIEMETEKEIGVSNSYRGGNSEEQPRFTQQLNNDKDHGTWTYFYPFTVKGRYSFASTEDIMNLNISGKSEADAKIIRKAFIKSVRYSYSWLLAEGFGNTFRKVKDKLIK